MSSMYLGKNDKGETLIQNIKISSDLHEIKFETVPFDFD